MRQGDRVSTTMGPGRIATVILSGHDRRTPTGVVVVLDSQPGHPGYRFDARYVTPMHGNAAVPSSSRSAGPRYDPHRPWLLIGYRPGGGHPKSVAPFATQAEAAHALRGEIAREGAAPPGDRYAFRVRHVTGKMSLWWALSPIDRVEYNELARAQLHVARLQGLMRMDRRYSRHGNATARKKRVDKMTLSEACAAQRDLEERFRATFSGNGLQKAAFRRNWRKYEARIKTLRGSRGGHGNAAKRALKYTNVQVRDMLANAYYFYEPLRAAAKERGFTGTSVTPIGDVIKYLRRVTPASGDRRRARHGNAELQTGKFYAYKGHRVWLDVVPGGYFALVEGTAIQARATTQAEAFKKLREKLDTGAANYRRKGRRKERR
jgi:hypothetical protein